MQRLETEMRAAREESESTSSRLSAYGGLRQSERRESTSRNAARSPGGSLPERAVPQTCPSFRSRVLQCGFFR